MKKFVGYFSIAFMAALGPVQAQNYIWRQQPTQVIDVPTAAVVDHYGYHVSFRFYQDGNLQTKTSFGVFPRLNIGFGLDGEKVIGADDARLNEPTINVKFRLFDGPGFLPALAIGYDGQGYVFNRDIDEYEQREKGFYLAATKEIGLPELLLTLGVNNFDFDESNATRGFAALSYTYQRLVGIMLEYDHATEYDERRLNGGLRYFITPLFAVDVIARNIPEGPGGDDRETERVVRLGYTGSF